MISQKHRTKRFDRFAKIAVATLALVLLFGGCDLYRNVKGLRNLLRNASHMRRQFEKQPVVRHTGNYWILCSDSGHQHTGATGTGIVDFSGASSGGTVNIGNAVTCADIIISVKDMGTAGNNASSIDLSNIFAGDLSVGLQTNAGGGGPTGTLIIGAGSLDFSGDTIVGGDSAKGILTGNGATESIGSGAGSLFDIGRTDSANVAGGSGAVEFSGALSVDIYVSQPRLGTLTGSANSESDTLGTTTLSGSATYTISASDQVLVGDSPGATNAGGTLNLNGAGGIGWADLRTGYNDVTTGTNSTGSVDLSDGNFNAQIDPLTNGSHDVGNGSGEAALTFDADNGDQNTFVLASPNANGSSVIPNYTTGMLLQHGGSWTVNDDFVVGLNGGTVSIGPRIGSYYDNERTAVSGNPDEEGIVENAAPPPLPPPRPPPPPPPVNRRFLYWGLRIAVFGVILLVWLFTAAFGDRSR